MAKSRDVRFRGRGDEEGLFGDRVGELEAITLQEHPGADAQGRAHFFAGLVTVIEIIADDGVAAVEQMLANLVVATGAGASLAPRRVDAS